MRLTKHHGLGNDFLVLLDLDGIHPVSRRAGRRALRPAHRASAPTVCIRVTAGTGDADVTMQLLNADGSEAEMSGNGIRCLAQAVFQAGLAAPPRAAGGHRRRAAHRHRRSSRTGPRTHRFSVEMGQAKVGEPTSRSGSTATCCGPPGSTSATRTSCSTGATPRLPGPRRS